MLRFGRIQPRRFDLFVGFARAAVLRRRAAAVGEFSALDDDDERDRLRLTIDRPGDDRLHANAEAAPGDALGPRDSERAGMRGEKRVGVGADQLFDVELGLGRGRRRLRLPKGLRGMRLAAWSASFGMKLAAWSVKSHAASAMAQATSIVAIFIAGMAAPVARLRGDWPIRSARARRMPSASACSATSRQAL